MHHGWYNAWIGIYSTFCDFCCGVGVMKTEMAELHEDKDGFLKRSDMTLRDYFAGQVIAGLLQSTNLETLKRIADKNKMTMTKAFGVMAYNYADAMLEARK